MGATAFLNQGILVLTDRVEQIAHLHRGVTRHYDGPRPIGASPDAWRVECASGYWFQSYGDQSGPVLTCYEEPIREPAPLVPR
jgi:hypothetical protein